MQIAFTICSDQYDNDYFGQYRIVTPYFFGERLTWDLRMRKIQSGDIAFALTLKISPHNIVIPCARFSVSFVTDFNEDPRSSHSFTRRNSVNTIITAEGTEKFSQTSLNVKYGNVLYFTVPMCFIAPERRHIKCEIEFEENVKVESQVSAGEKLFQDVMNSAEPSRFSDVILTTADGRKFHVHSCFLVEQSPVFATMLEGERFIEGKERKIETPDINAATMEEVLRYVYADCVNSDALKVLAPEILYVAEKYQLAEPLKLHCIRAMINSTNVSNALSFLLMAQMYSSIELKLCAIKVVVGNLNEIRRQDGWKELLEKEPALVDELFEFAARRLSSQ